MDLNEIAVFTRVVQAGSFTAAAKALGMPKSTVSRKVADLEERLQARPLPRPTRKLILTDPRRLGLPRVPVGPNASWLGDIVADYLKRNPEVQIELLVTSRTVDLVEERFD